MKKGIVKFFLDVEGYGFIIDNKGNEHFVHYSNIKMDGHKTLEKGQKVMFKIGKNGNRTEAVEVIVC